MRHVFKTHEKLLCRLVKQLPTFDQGEVWVVGGGGFQRCLKTVEDFCVVYKNSRIH